MEKEIAFVRPGESVSVEECFEHKSSTSISFWSEVRRESPQNESGTINMSSPGLEALLTVNTLRYGRNESSAAFN